MGNTVFCGRDMKILRQSLSVVLRGTTQMYNIKSADKKVT